MRIAACRDVAAEGGEVWRCRESPTTLVAAYGRSSLRRLPSVTKFSRHISTVARKFALPHRSGRSSASILNKSP